MRLRDLIAHWLSHSMRCTLPGHVQDSHKLAMAAGLSQRWLTLWQQQYSTSARSLAWSPALVLLESPILLKTWM